MRNLEVRFRPDRRACLVLSGTVPDGCPGNVGARFRTDAGRYVPRLENYKFMVQDSVQIGIFGKRNQGKSSLMNLLSGQQVSIVSEQPGTTTDPVRKSCEVFGIGKCVFVDTAGFDDKEGIGRLRVEKTLGLIDRLDVGILLISGNTFTEEDKSFAAFLAQAGVPFVIVHNKSDEAALSIEFRTLLARLYPKSPLLDFSVKEALRQGFGSTAGTAGEGSGTSAPARFGSPYGPIAEALSRLLEENGSAKAAEPALEGLVREGDCVLMVCPIDAEAPKDRLILPQVLLARQCLDYHALPVLCQVEELPGAFRSLRRPPALVITDSQVFGQVAAQVPDTCPLTSFSICLARQKGNFSHYLAGTRTLPALEDGQQVLMLESCTHQVNCHDIGRVKLPAVLQEKTGKRLSFRYVSGLDPLPDDLSGIALAIQCGGCMVTARQLETRIRRLRSQGIPVSNYGMAIAWCNGIFERATRMFG